MPNLAALTPFRQLAAVAPFTRNVDALFKDFFLSPLSFDATATRQPGPNADIPDNTSGQEVAPSESNDPPNSQDRSALSPATDNTA